jgi:enoyl-CoA hydratase/carnithine racemase
MRRRGVKRAGVDEAPAVLLERDGGVLVATLNRPRALNAYNMAMRDALHAALELAASDATIAVFVVRGNGRAFSAGGDLAEFGLAPTPIRAREVRQLRDVWGRWATLPCVAIAAVHGFAAGGGLEMALLCDLVVCSRDARFGLPETGLGLIPGVGGTQTLPRVAGLGRAAAVLLAGEWLDADAALRAGVATAVVPRPRLDATVRRMAARIARLDPAVLRAVKAAVARGLDLPLAAGLGLERRLAATLGRGLG